MSKTNIVRVSIEASAAGSKLDVQEATLSLGINAIPTIELVCAPSESKGAQPLKPVVSKPTISDFSKLYEKLADAADGLKETGEVSIDIESTGDYGNKDSVKLKDWVLVGVGMSGIGATAAPYMSVILQHPICRLTKVGSIFETPKKDITEKIDQITESCGNFIEMMDAVNDFVAGADDCFWQAPNEYPPKFRHALKNGEFKLREYLTWGGGNGIFLGIGGGSEMKSRLAQGMGRFAIPKENGSSIWDALVMASGHMLMSVTQNESNNFTTKRLVLEPTSPWKRFSVTLDEQDCILTEVPGMNSFKVIGVMARKLGPFCPLADLGLVRNGNPHDKKPVEEVMYVPPNVNPSESDGRIMKTSAPVVLESAFRRDAPMSSGPITSGATDADKMLREYYDEMIERYCKAVFQIAAGSMMHAKAQMALWFRDRGKALILPGLSCRFVTDGKALYYGYIRNVVHHMSTAGNCGTTVMMSYVRHSSDFKVAKETAINMGDRNAAYYVQ